MDIEEIRTEILRKVAERFKTQPIRVLTVEELDKLWKED